MSNPSDRGWVLPTNIHPEDSWCYVIEVPKDVNYLRALRGALLELSLYYNWQRGTGDEVSQVIKVWENVLDSADINLIDGDCGEFVLDCNDIISCIDSSPSLRDKLQYTVLGEPNVSGDVAKVSMDAFTDIGCNLDNLYGYSKALWAFINQNSIDFLQIMSEATNTSEQISKFITLIPGAELLPIDEILGWIEAFGNYNLEAYESSVTVGLEQEIICDLFCLAQTNCGLDFGQVYDYFIEKLGGVNAPTALATFAEWVTFMALGNYPGDRIVYLYSAFQLALAFVGQQYLNIKTINTYALYAQAGEPDNEWTILCDDCDCEIIEDYYDFNVSPHSDVWTIRADISGCQWVNGLGYQGVNPAGSQIWTDKYSKITSVTAVFTASSGTPLCVMYDFQTSPPVVGDNIGGVPFVGDYDLLESLLVVAYSTAGTYTSRLRELTIEGCINPDWEPLE